MNKIALPGLALAALVFASSAHADMSLSAFAGTWSGMRVDGATDAENAK
jgi:hypothetical protein